MDSFWSPSQARVTSSNLYSFQSFIEQKLGRKFGSYDELHQFSVDDMEVFWAELEDYLGILWQVRPHKVLRWDPEKFMGSAEFFSGGVLNFAENLLKHASDDDQLTICFIKDGCRDIRKITISDLVEQAGQLAGFLKSKGVCKGDRVVGVVSNSIESIVCMLATAWLGGVWSSCSPDFGVPGVLDRFSQLEPDVFIFNSSYSYNGQVFHCQSKASQCLAKLNPMKAVIEINEDVANGAHCSGFDLLSDIIGNHKKFDVPEFAACGFNDPLYIMFSSGTTGRPKCIVHGVGGTLIQHLKELSLHSDLGKGDTLFYYTTCGWMMWNWMVSAIGVGASLVLYDGSPSFPDLGILWRIVEEQRVSVFGTSPKFLSGCINSGVELKGLNLDHLVTILSTGSPLLPEHMEWVKSHVGDNILLSSISGGTDIISCFMLGNPTLPVNRGEIQCRGLGMAVEAWDESGNPQIGQKGELVCTKPFVSMPLGFLNDEFDRLYKASYFSYFTKKSVWRHGDYIEITPMGGVIVYGRSDTTLNPGGVRIGTAEIYRRVELINGISDSIVIGKPIDGDVEVWLFVKLQAGTEMSESFAQKIRAIIRQELTPRHVPKKIFPVQDIPYTRSGKKVEVALLKLAGNETVGNLESIQNSECLADIQRIISDYRSLSF